LPWIARQHKAAKRLVKGARPSQHPVERRDEAVEFFVAVVVHHAGADDAVGRVFEAQRLDAAVAVEVAVANGDLLFGQVGRDLARAAALDGKGEGRHAKAAVAGLLADEPDLRFGEQEVDEAAGQRFFLGREQPKDSGQAPTQLVGLGLEVLGVDGIEVVDDAREGGDGFIVPAAGIEDLGALALEEKWFWFWQRAIASRLP
jgi:hypothetical protein